MEILTAIIVLLGSYIIVIAACLFVKLVMIERFKKSKEEKGKYTIRDYEVIG